ncbi:MAG TPA: hypothetical protein P5136_01395 [Methanofastidiosum sp.]|nr:hypothetical protein [Methanofastidiosum sp.]
MKKYNYAIDVSFSIEGDWDDFDKIPYHELILGLQLRMNDLVANQDPEAFGLVDCYEIERPDKKFKVRVIRSYMHGTTLEVTATNEEEAEDKAKEMMNDVVLSLIGPDENCDDFAEATEIRT